LLISYYKKQKEKVIKNEKKKLIQNLLSIYISIYINIYMNKVYLAPSLYSHILNGILLLFAFIILYKNYSKIRNVEPYKLIILILFFSLGVGIHGLSHLGMEPKYNFNPVTLIIPNK
jgi:hypothetical protein